MTDHRWGEKVIPSGFFDIPEVSAVISTSAGTIAKFNRMGLLSGFGDREVFMIRQGTCIDSSPGATGPKLLKSVVNAADYGETWVERMDVYRNTRAKLPLPKGMFPGAAHHWCDENGKRRIFAPQFHPTGSTTRIETGFDIERVLKDYDGPTLRLWDR
ncbi:hypothetical protein [Rhizobium laguerreae]|uniref:hypothetical protein n=1 Tax=Rhizobium laguerreae TaxID=1076926 RepID=UPI001C918A0D|nr:hypothetical protein [Rhizobium laguerreae]